MAKKLTIAQEIAKQNAENLKILQKEEKLQKSIADVLMQKVNGQGKLNTTQKTLLSDIQGESDISQKIVLIQAAKQKILLQQAKTGKNIGSALLEQLDDLDLVVKTEESRKNLADEILDTQKESKDALAGSLGTMGEMLTAGTSIAFSMAALKGLTEAFGAVFETTIGFASELNKELGISGEAAAKIGMMNLSTDIVFSRFSIDQLNTATKDFATTMGTTAGITNDLRNSMAEITSMGVGGEDAAKLSQSFETANGSAVKMTTKIKEMANDSGVMASTTFKDLATQQNLMLGATEKEILALAKKTIELNKQGVSLEQMKGISEGMMDIEGSMKAQAKARIMLQGKLTEQQIGGMQGMAAAALEFQKTGDMSVMTKALKEVSMSADQFKDLGPRGQEVYAQSIGMTADSLGDVIRKQEQMAKVEETLGSGAAGALEMYQKVPQSIKDGVVALLSFGAQQMIISKMQTGEFGIGKMFGKGDKGGGGPLKTEVPGSEEVGKTESGGGLKSLAEGLREMGDGKVFAGIGAVALAGPAFIIALPAIPFLLFMGKVKLKALEENFSGLATGLNSMASTFMGSLAIAAFGIAAIPSIASIPFLLFMGLIPLAQIATNLTSLAVGLNAMSSTFVGSLALAAFGVASVIALPSLLFLGGIALLGAVGAAGLVALGGGLATLGGIAASGLPFLAIALIGALGVAMIPFAFALSLVTPLIDSFGKIIIGVFGAMPPIIDAVANGFVTMMGAISPENVLGMLMLGPALLSASVGMIAFSAALAVGGIASFFGGGIMDSINELSTSGQGLKNAGDGLASVAGNISIISASMAGLGSLVSPLYLLAGGLMSISAGLTSVAFSGLLAMPVFAALGGLSAIAPALEGLGNFFGGNDDSSESTSSNSSTDSGTTESTSTESSMGDVVKAINELRGDISAQPILLTIDGKAVQQISRVQSRQSSATRGSR